MNVPPQDGGDFDGAGWQMPLQVQIVYRVHYYFDIFNLGVHLNKYIKDASNIPILF